MDDQDLLRARWATFAALFLVFGFYLSSIMAGNWWLIAILALLTAALLTAVLEFWLRLSLRRASGGQQFAEVRADLSWARSRIQVSISGLNKLLQAHSEREILEVALQLGLEYLRVDGASFVPYDEWGQSLPALTVGTLPDSAPATWGERLVSPETRQACKNCHALHANSGCGLLPSQASGALQVNCFPLISAGREVGVFNFYSDQEQVRDPEINSRFSEIVGCAGQVLENLHSRDQEIAALLYLQTSASSKSDIAILLNSLLENVQRALDVDFALMYLPAGLPGQKAPGAQMFSRVRQDNSELAFMPDLPFLEGVWKNVLSSGQSLSLENVILDKQRKWKALLAVPLVWRGEEPAGVLVLGSTSSSAFVQRQQALLETLAGQAALLIQNARLMVQVEYQAVVDERTRLAREIHDGLAQTLAFLKIQAAQMQNYLLQGETEKLTSTLQANYRTLSDAYIDARQAIGNLRRAPSASLSDWIAQVAADYRLSTGQLLEVLIDPMDDEYPANIQAQLIRIVQEALSNTRKHAKAQHVSILGHREEDAMLIEVHDDGCGFAPESVDGNSRYGLRGMRERAESIGADFQITSRPGFGTVVSLRLPITLQEQI